METMLALLVVHFCLRFIHGLQSRGSSDHCYYDRFEPRCDDDEVIVIINALYGRMKFGRCVKTNFGYIGCYDDVIHLIQERCLGRRECNVEVVEPTFPGLKPCNDELKSYLEVEYACVKELLPEDPTTCDLRLELNVAALTPDVIMTSSLFGGVTCGDDQSPFRVKVDPGQRINVSMVTLLSSDQSESENVNRKRSIFISHDYVMEYRDDDGDDDDDENKNSYSASYYGVDLDEGANDDDGYGEGGDDDDLEPNDVISGRTETFHFARVRSTSLTNSASSSIPSSLIKSSSSSSSSLVSSVPSVVASLNESSLVPSSSSSSSRSSSVATCRSATPRPFIASSSTSSSTSSSSSSSSSSSLSSGEVIRHKSSRDGHRRFRRGLKSLHLISKRHEPKQCRQMGRIVESQLPQSETSELCGGRSHKLYHVTTSQSNSLEIYISICCSLLLLSSFEWDCNSSTFFNKICYQYHLIKYFSHLIILSAIHFCHHVILEF